MASLIPLGVESNGGNYVAIMPTSRHRAFLFALSGGIRYTMHVLFIATPDLSYVSGSSLSLKYSVEALAAQGVQCTVLCQHAPGGEMGAGISYVEVPMPLDYQVTTDTRPSSSDLMQCMELLLEASRHCSDVDIVHSVYGTFTGLAGLTIAAVCDIPTVVTTYGRDLLVGARIDQRYANMMRVVYRNAAAVVASDDAIAGIVAETYGVPHGSVHVIPPGANFGMLRRVAAEIERGDGPGLKIAAVQSSFNRSKGLGVLVEALAQVIEQVPEVTLLVAGHDDTPDASIEAEILAQASDLGVTENIRLLGHLPHIEVAALIRSCDVLVDPRTINSFSSCIHEAMTLGVPVIASDVACNAAALTGERGLLHTAGDASSLAKAIMLFASSPEIGQVLVEKNGKHMDELCSQYDSSVVGERLRQLYESLVGGGFEAESTKFGGIVDDNC
jgi:L-malate glycosyltransferase